MGIFRDIRLFFSFKKSIHKNKNILEDQYGIRIDNADRMYTVINIPANLIEEPYNLRKADIDLIAQNYIRDYISNLSQFLNSIGISELYDFYEPIKKVDKYSYLIIIGYKQIDSTDINRIIYRIGLPFLTISLLAFLIFILFR
jgi:type II secretory pathway component HofQ